MYITHNIDIPLQMRRINERIYYNTKILIFVIHKFPDLKNFKCTHLLLSYCLYLAGDVVAVEREEQEDEGQRQKGTDTTEEDDHQITHIDSLDSDQNGLSKDVES